MTLLEETKDLYLRNCEAYKQLVGTLYPTIVYNEILLLYNSYIANGGKAEDLPYRPMPPGFFGTTQ